MNIESIMQDLLEKRKQSGTYRSLKILDSKAHDFTSNDYLGLAKIDFLSGEDHSFIDNGAGGSRLLSGNKAYHEQAEAFMADYFNAESCLLFNSGYVANLGLLSSVPQKGDAILMDELSHICIKEGARLSRANHFNFRHNDMSELEKKLNTVNANNIFIVVESIYSMDGDEAPLIDIVELAKKYNAHVIVDEAHSTGLLSNDGSGLCCQLGIEKEVFARVYTFGKAMGAHGAVVAGSEILKSYLINYSRQFIYTTSLPHHSIQTIIKAINYRKLNGELWKSLQNKIEKFRNQLNKEINLLESNHPIQGVITGSSEKAIRLANFLQEKGFDIRPIVSPTVPLHQERVRICLHAFNTDESIDELCRQLNQYYS